MKMESIRNIIVGIVGLAIAVLTLFVMATVGLAVVGFAVVAGLVGLIYARFVARPKAQKQREPRVWNDGHGTIIDM